MSHFLSLVFCPPDCLFAPSNKAPTSVLCSFAHLHLILSWYWTFSAVKQQCMVDQAHFHRNTLDCFSKTSLSSLNLCVQKHVRGMWEGEQKGTDTPWGGTVASVSSWIRHEAFNHAWEPHVFNGLITPELSPCPKCFLVLQKRAFVPSTT